jgi:hypothetical protein
MNLAKVKGKPGEFINTETGEVIKFEDGYYGSFYSTKQLASGLQGSTEVTFFGDTAGAGGYTKAATNMSRPFQLPNGYEMVVERLLFEVPLAMGNTVIVGDDIKKILYGGYVKWLLNEDFLIGDGRPVQFPGGYGIAGMTNESGACVMSNGQPSLVATYQLEEPQFIGDGNNFKSILTFPGFATWPASAVTNVTLSQACFVVCHYWGLIRKAATP